MQYSSSTLHLRELGILLSIDLGLQEKKAKLTDCIQELYGSMVEKTPLHALHSNHIHGMESTIKKTQTVQQLKLCWVRPEHVSSQNVSFNNLEVVFALFSTIYNFT